MILDLYVFALTRPRLTKSRAVRIPPGSSGGLRVASLNVTSMACPPAVERPRRGLLDQLRHQLRLVPLRPMGGILDKLQVHVPEQPGNVAREVGILREGVRNAFSYGNPVQPAAEADQRAGGLEDITDPVQQPAPAAQRPRVGKVGDRLLHQRAEPRLQPVERVLGVAEPVLGAAVPNRRMPVLPPLGQPPEPSIQQAGHVGGVQHLAQARQRDEFVLMTASRPAPVAPQQVTPDGRHRHALGGVGVALGVVQRLLVGPPGDLLAGVSTPADGLVPVNVGTHRASRTLRLFLGGLGEGLTRSTTGLVPVA
jgi:hypothetical protein